MEYVCKGAKHKRTKVVVYVKPKVNCIYYKKQSLPLVFAVINSIDLLLPRPTIMSNSIFLPKNIDSETKTLLLQIKLIVTLTL